MMMMMIFHALTKLIFIFFIFRLSPLCVVRFSDWFLWFVWEENRKNDRRDARFQENLCAVRDVTRRTSGEEFSPVTDAVFPSLLENHTKIDRQMFFSPQLSSPMRMQQRMGKDARGSGAEAFSHLKRLFLPMNP